MYVPYLLTDYYRQVVWTIPKVPVSFPLKSFRLLSSMLHNWTQIKDMPSVRKPRLRSPFHPAVLLKTAGQIPDCPVLPVLPPFHRIQASGKKPESHNSFPLFLLRLLLPPAMSCLLLFSLQDQSCLPVFLFRYKNRPEDHLGTEHPPPLYLTGLYSAHQYSLPDFRLPLARAHTDNRRLLPDVLSQMPGLPPLPSYSHKVRIPTMFSLFLY